MKYKRRISVVTPAKRMATITAVIGTRTDPSRDTEAGS